MGCYTVSINDEAHKVFFGVREAISFMNERCFGMLSCTELKEGIVATLGNFSLQSPDGNIDGIKSFKTALRLAQELSRDGEQWAVFHRTRRNISIEAIGSKTSGKMFWDIR